MNIKCVVVGELDTNCYILEKDKKVIIVDPGAEDKKISDLVKEKEVVGIIVTHSHDDHIGGLNAFLNKYHTNLYNRDNLQEGENRIDIFSFQVIYTPGHLDDAITIYFPFEKVMLVGDFIFKGSIGRTDLKGASTKDMKKSIAKILKYDKDIKILPGHLESTTLGEKEEMLRFFFNYLE